MTNGTELAKENLKRDIANSIASTNVKEESFRDVQKKLVTPEDLSQVENIKIIKK
jgi:hypothetical protein